MHFRVGHLQSSNTKVVDSTIIVCMQYSVAWSQWFNSCIRYKVMVHINGKQIAFWASVKLQLCSNLSVLGSELKFCKDLSSRVEGINTNFSRLDNWFNLNSCIVAVAKAGVSMVHILGQNVWGAVIGTAVHVSTDSVVNSQVITWGSSALQASSSSEKSLSAISRA